MTHLLWSMRTCARMASEKVERPEWMPPPITLTIIDGRSSYVFEDATKPAPPIITSNVSSTNPAPPIITSDASSATTAARLATYAKDFVFRPSACGLTAFAVRDIKCGERLVAEEPLVWWTIRPEETVTTAGIDALVNALDPTDREDYYSLCQNAMHGSEKTAYGIWLSNAYPTDSPMEAAQNKLAGVVENAKTGAVYAVCCRFNHSCTPNGHCAWNPRIDRQTIHALRDITRGEQITVCYLPELGMARCERQQRLLDDFGFDCACDACKLQGEALVQSDKRRTRIGQLSNKVPPRDDRATGEDHEPRNNRRPGPSDPACLASHVGALEGGAHTRYRRLAHRTTWMTLRLMDLCSLRGLTPARLMGLGSSLTPGEPRPQRALCPCLFLPRFNVQWIHRWWGRSIGVGLPRDYPSILSCASTSRGIIQPWDFCSHVSSPLSPPLHFPTALHLHTSVDDTCDSFRGRSTATWSPAVRRISTASAPRLSSSVTSALNSWRLRVWAALAGTRSTPRAPTAGRWVTSNWRAASQARRRSPRATRWEKTRKNTRSTRPTLARARPMLGRRRSRELVASSPSPAACHKAVTGLLTSGTGSARA